METRKALWNSENSHPSLRTAEGEGDLGMGTLQRGAMGASALPSHNGLWRLSPTSQSL